LLEEAPVCLFEMGSDRWRKFDTFPNQNHKIYYLSSKGLSSIREDSGSLESIQNPKSKIQNSSDVLVHDPWRPVPSLGGHAAMSAGTFERSHIDCRSDVLTYTSEVLEEDLYLVGDLIIEVWCSADKPSYDLCAVLSQVYPDGRVYNVTQGYLRCDGSDLTKRTIQLQTTCVRIAKGNFFRLSLSAACFPAYAMNPGNGSSLGMEAEVITLMVSCGGEIQSQILLPLNLPN
jgi:uncharacterized protein